MANELLGDMLILAVPIAWLLAFLFGLASCQLWLRYRGLRRLIGRPQGILRFSLGQQEAIRRYLHERFALSFYLWIVAGMALICPIFFKGIFDPASRELVAVSVLAFAALYKATSRIDAWLMDLRLGIDEGRWR